MTAFAAGFILGALVAALLVVILMATITIGRMSDLQDRIDELEAANGGMGGSSVKLGVGQ